MDDFLAWQGWAGVGAVAQILSLATIVAALWRLVIQRRQMPLFQLTWDFIATATVDGDRYHLVEFRNVGRGSGEFMAFTLTGARANLVENYVTPRVLGSGQSFRLFITSPGLSAAWARWIVRTPDHGTRIKVFWRPLIRAGVLAEQWRGDLEAWESRSYYEMVRDRVRPPSVGPGAAPAATIDGRNKEKLVSLLTRGDKTETYFSLLAGSDEPTALPYVGPK